MTKILITGGSGFIGASLIKRLSGNGVSLRVFDLSEDRSTVESIAGVVPGLEWIQGDIRDAGAIEAALAGCDGVVHLAGLLTTQCANDPVLGAQVNLIGTLNVFNAVKKQGLRQVIYASSAGVFGPDDPVNPCPVNHYGAFKLATEGSARAYWRDAGIASIGLRPFVVYGPGREVGVSAGPSLACRAIARGQDYDIPFSGSTGLVHVDDVVDVIVRALGMRLEGAQVFNLTGDVIEIAALAELFNSHWPAARIGVSGGSLNIVSGVSEADLDLAMPARQKTPLLQGLQSTVAFYSHQH